MENAKVWIYAIATNDFTQKRVEIVGIDDQPIQWVAIDSLQVAVSLDIGERQNGLHWEGEASADPKPSLAGASLSHPNRRQVDFSLPLALGTTATGKGLEHAFLEYELVLRALCSSQDCLPIRFGTKMPVQQVQELLRNQGKRFQEQLERFAGCCELLIRWAVPIQILDRASTHNSMATTRSTTTESGTSYLARRREQSRITSAAERLASETGARLQELYPAVIRKVLSSARKFESKTLSDAMQPRTESEFSDFSNLIVIEIALLVLKCDAERIKSLLHSLCIHGEAPTLISGPWPIYSFVGQ